MKILHTADWHLGHTFHGYDRLEEHRHFLGWLLDTLRDELPDVLLVAGDIYDSSNPSAAAEELLYDFLLQATEAVDGLQIVLIAGNHDSAGRIDAPAALLKKHNIYVRGTLPLKEENQTPDYEHLVLPLSSRMSPEAEIVCLAVPFLRTSDYPSGLTPTEGLRQVFEKLHGCVSHSVFKDLPLVAVAHFYASGSEIFAQEHSERLVIGGQDCIPAEVVGHGISYTALGHLHKAQAVKCSSGRTEYAGSPLPLSFSERNYIHGITMIEMDGQGNASTRRIRYNPLRPLASLPKQGAAHPEEILDLVSQLPPREKNDNGSDWPYLEIRVMERRPEPELLHQVATALAEKAVHFCRMIRENPDSSGKKGSNETIDTPQSLQPIEMADRIYQEIYHTAMPDELRTRFLEAQKSIEC